MNCDQLADIHARAFHETRPWGAPEFETLLASPHCFCVTDSHGFALGRVIADESELLTIAVDPAFQSKGLGRSLMLDYHAHAQNMRATSFFLEVAADNPVAIKLYESMRYTQSSRRRQYYQRVDGSRVDALIMASTDPR